MLNQRGPILFLFAILSYFMFLAWQDDHKKLEQKTKEPPIEQQLSTSTIPTPTESKSPSSAIPEVEVGDVKTVKEQQKQTKKANENSIITVTTSVLEIKINQVGGDIVSAKLLKYPQEKDHPETPVTIFTNDNGRIYIAQSGLIGKNTPDGSNKKATFISPQKNYQIKDKDFIEVPLKWVNPQGIVFTKKYTFSRDSYDIKLDYEVFNQSNQKFNTRLFTQLYRDQLGTEESKSGVGMRSFLGAAYSTDETLYEKLSFDDFADDKIKVTTKDGWVAIIQHYFVAAWVPEDKTKNEIYSLNVGKNVVIGLVQKTEAVLPGEKKDFKAQLYVGPKNQQALAKIAKGLDLTIDYGILWWIGQPIFAILKFLHSLVGNWGVAIILVTMVVKAMLYPLSNAQYRSFGKMRKIQPKMQALKERYGDDRQKMGQETMKMYKKEGVNPLGGCLPLLIQMPVFFALYWVLMESVEIRQAPFIFWIHDLSMKDPLFILPILMGLSMFLMQKMQPTAANMDPMQQKIMQFMPVVMTVFFLFFPAGLVLYWVVNNTLSIIQQTYVTRKMEKEDLKKASKK